MSKNKYVFIAVLILCVVILGCAIGISSRGGKKPAPSQADTTSSAAVSSDGTKGTSAITASTGSTTSSQSSEENAVSTVSSSASSSSASSTTTTASKQTAGSTAAGTYLYAYAGFNPVTTDMSVPYTRLLLNRKYKLPDGYVPKLAEAVRGSGVMMDYRVAPHYQEMYDAAKQDGITLTPISGYRSYERQKRNFDNQISEYMSEGMNKKDATIKASQIRLLPGTSEHNAGLAMDICSLSTSFENTEEAAWLRENAHKYGFILRYPKDKTDVTKIVYEPWHYRYVGPELAAELRSSGQVLEEYLGKDA